MDPWGEAGLVEICEGLYSQENFIAFWGSTDGEEAEAMGREVLMVNHGSSPHLLLLREGLS